MANTILLPVDLSGIEGGDTAPLNEALRLLDQGGALHVISVLPDFGLAQVSGFFSKDYETDLLHGFGEKLSAWVNANVPDEVDVHPLLVHVTVYDEILRVADKLKVDVIVMGAHRPELSDYLLGGNAARVVRQAKQSVYVVRN